MNTKDYTNPGFSQMILDWITGLPNDQAIAKMELMGVSVEDREVYLRLQGVPDTIDITPQMAIEGAPGQTRPMPQVGSRNVKQTF